jgi:hypothetical protein
MLSKITRLEKSSDRFQEVFIKVINEGKTPRQALRITRVLLAEEPGYNNRRK